MKKVETVEKIRLLSEIREAIKKFEQTDTTTDEIIENLLKIIKEVQILYYMEISANLGISVSRLICNFEKFKNIAALNDLNQ